MLDTVRSHLPDDGHQVVLAQTEELYVFHDHHLVVVLVEDRVVENVYKTENFSLQVARLAC